MKFYIIYLLLFINVYGEHIGGEWELKTQENIRVDYTPVKIHCQKINYSKGGVAVKYPEGYFSSIPYIYVSIELNKLKYSSDLIFSSIIVANNLNDISVFINIHAAGYVYDSIAEANNDDVFVNIFSFGK